MQPSLQEFLRNLVDYAGEFPPAKLPFEQAFSNYLKYSVSERSSILGRYVCALSQLENVAVKAKEVGRDVPVSLLIKPFALIESVEEELESSLAKVAAIRGECPSAVVESMELKFNEGLLDELDERALLEHIQLMRKVLLSYFESLGAKRLTVFSEIAFSSPQRDSEVWEEKILKMILVLGEMDKHSECEFGLKIRCGGDSPAQVPSCSQLAYAISRAAQVGVMLKFTAGLHHPVIRRNEEGALVHHGFFNVFGASLAAMTHGLDEQEVFQILNQDDPSEFAFRDDFLIASGHPIDLAQIGDFRASFATSFGSCSFTEPIEDLGALGLI